MQSFSRFVVLILVFSYTQTFSQSFDDCKASMYAVSAEKNAAFDGSLHSWFGSALQNKLNGLSGTVFVNVLIDSVGNVCCRKIDNRTGKDISALDLLAVVKTMPAWKPAIQNNFTIHFLAMLRLDFRENGLEVSYLNEKPLMSAEVVNGNRSNHPLVHKDRKTKSTWKVWTFANSVIPGDMSRKVAMDSKGVIWYCTDKGLVRIYGENWQVFTGRNTPALAGDNKNTWTTALFIDRNDNVWVRAFDRIVRFDGKQWARMDTADAPLSRFKNIVMDNRGQIWTHTPGKLMTYDGERWTDYAAENPGINTNSIKEVFVDKADNIWIATDNGIHKFSNGQWTLFNSKNTSIPNDDISCINGDKDGNIYAGTTANANNALIKIDPAGQVTTYPTGVIWNLAIDPNTQHVWIASHGEGLVRFDGNKLQWFTTENTILPHNTVTSILVDLKGDKWISTFGGLVYTNLK